MLLAIYGAGGLGREVLELAGMINSAQKRWDGYVFVDDADITEVIHGCRVLKLNELNKYASVDNCEVVIAVGEPHVRALLWNKIKNMGLQLATLIHPNVHIPESTNIAEGVVICSNAFISCDVRIHENAYIQPMAAVGHDSVIGAHTVLSIFSSIAGGCRIGSESYLAMSVPVKEGLSVGNSSIVGMGAVVLRDIPDNVIALGNPARVMLKNEDKKVFKH